MVGPQPLNIEDDIKKKKTTLTRTATRNADVVGVAAVATRPQLSRHCDENYPFSLQP